MNRQTALVAALGALLILVLAFVFIVRPRQQEVAEIQTEIEEVRAEQGVVRTQIARLEEVRARSPEVEAALAAAESVIPRDDAKIPAAVRQLQMAANDSGADLASVALDRPADVAELNEDEDVEVPEDLTSLSVTVTVRGGYFQIVDFLRRIEDPVVTPRALLWTNAAVSLEDYPTLNANLSGVMFAYLEDLPEVDDTATEAPDAEGADAPDQSPTEGTTTEEDAS